MESASVARYVKAFGEARLAGEECAKVERATVMARTVRADKERVFKNMMTDHYPQSLPTGPAMELVRATRAQRTWEADLARAQQEERDLIRAAELAFDALCADSATI